MSLHLSGPVDILRLQTRDFEMGRNAPKNTFNKSRYRRAAIREKTLGPARVRQTDRHTHHWPVTRVGIKTACKKFEIMSSNRIDINPIVKLGTTTTKTVSYSLCEIIDVLLLHHLNTTMEQLSEPSLKRTPEDLSFEKNKKNTASSKSLRITSLTSGCPTGLCRQLQLCPLLYVVLVQTAYRGALPCGQSNRKAPQSKRIDTFLMKAPAVENRISRRR